MAVFSTGLVWLAALDRGFILPDCRLRRLLVSLGARSYALYLVHIPAFFVAREIWFRLGAGSPEIPAALSGFGLTFALAEMNWRWVERPLRRFGARLALHENRKWNNRPRDKLEP
jgi:peptidoglycan/LPS O-acetylase OafA/YrhL